MMCSVECVYLMSFIFQDVLRVLYAREIVPRSTLIEAEEWFSTRRSPSSPGPSAVFGGKFGQWPPGMLSTKRGFCECWNHSFFILIVEQVQLSFYIVIVQIPHYLTA
jgi:hypothetical protein